MTRVLFVGQDPKTVDFTDPALPPGLNAEKIQAGIDLAATKIADVDGHFKTARPWAVQNRTPQAK